MKKTFAVTLFVVCAFFTTMMGCSSRQYGSGEPGLYFSKDSVKPHPKFNPEKDLPMFDPRIAYFDTAKWTLKSEARKALVPTSVYLKSNSKVGLVIEGYCDERGSEDYNQVLGEKRASAAKDFLVDLGISPERIRTISYGKMMGREASLMAENRRVGFQLIYPTLTE